MTTFICCVCAYGCVPTTYCRSCRPSFWNFVRNLGYSQAITHGEMRWLRLHTQPIFISHPYYIYKRCLTTFICCGCAYGCVHTTLRPLMLTKLVEFCHKSGQVSADIWWWNEVIEAVDPTHIHLTSILYIYKVFDNLYMLCMCIWMRPHHVLPLMPTKLLEFCQKSGLLPGDNSWWNAVIEAAHPTHIHLTSILYI